MPQRFWFGASVLGAALAGLLAACSPGDAATGGGGTSATGGGGSGGGDGGPNGGKGAVGGSGASSAGSSASSGGAAAAASGAGASGGNASGGRVGDGSAGGGGDGSPTGGSSDGAPSAEQLLAKLGSCSKISGPYNPDDPGSGSINVCQTGTAVWWKADLDVDCDGIQTPPCDTDNTGQPQTSIVDLTPDGDVDPTKLPYFVIPLGSPETEWYTTYGIELGQIGAVVYEGQVIYGIFADQAGGNFIGEASYEMCSLFIGANNCDPNNGGIDALDVTYVTFTGTKARASGQDIYDHDKHTQLGEAAARAWLGLTP